MVNYIMAFLWTFLCEFFGGASKGWAIVKWIVSVVSATALHATLKLTFKWGDFEAVGEEATWAVAITAVLLVLITFAIARTWLLTSPLKIIDIERDGIDRRRIIVKNRSPHTVRFSATLKHIRPRIPHHNEPNLQITGAPEPHAEGNIHGFSSRTVDVLLVDGNPTVRFMFAHPNYQPYPVPESGVVLESEYEELKISVSPVHPSTGSGDERSFRIVQKNGTPVLELIPIGSVKATFCAIAVLLAGMLPLAIGNTLGGLTGLAIGAVITLTALLIYESMEHPAA